jgi:hypothetical protein
MKITQSTLRRIIQEEIAAVTKESAEEYYMGRDFDDGRSSVTGKPTFKERERERKRREAAKEKKDADAALMSMYARSQMEEDLDEEIDEDLEEAPEDMRADKERLRKLSKEKGPAARKAAEEAEFDKRHLARLRALDAKRKEKEDREEAMRMARLGREEYPGERTSAVYREGSDATNKLKSLIVKVLKERKK